MSLRKVREEHRFISADYGNGYTEPRERYEGCSCGISYFEWVQHRCEGDCWKSHQWDSEAAANAHSRHILAVLLRSRMITGGAS